MCMRTLFHSAGGYHTVMSVKFFAVLFALAVLFLSCSKEGRKKEEEELSAGNVTSADIEQHAGKPPEPLTDKDMERLLGETGTIKEFTPEIFVALTILYQKESRKWLAESAALPADEQKKYIDDANRSFFGAFGITEEQYISYSQSHIDELNAYMSEHPELMADIVIED